MAQQPICLFGAGGHGRGVAAQIARETGEPPVFAGEVLAVGTLLAGTVVAFGAIADITRHALIVTIGASSARRMIQTKAQIACLELTSFVADPDRYFGHIPGKGTVVLSAAVVNSETTLGMGVIVNNRAVVEHSCSIGNFIHIAPGAVVAVDVQIGQDFGIGANATILLQGISITDQVTIGAGALVTRDILVTGTYVGQPAHLLTDRPVGYDKQRTPL